MNWFHRLLIITAIGCSIIILTGCSATKFVPDNQFMLSKNTLKADQEDFNLSNLNPYIRQSANSKWFSLVKIPLGVYAMSGTDTTKWMNRFLQRVGEAPVIFDTLQAQLTCRDLTTAMQNMGHLHASTEMKVKTKGKKLKAEYLLHPNEQYYIRNMNWDIHDNRIKELFLTEMQESQLLKEGNVFSIDNLEAERKRITNILMSKGYYHFNKDFIQFSADTARNDIGVDVTLHLLPYRVNDGDSVGRQHPVYTVRNVKFTSGDANEIRLRKKTLENNTAIQAGQLFNSKDLQKTYNNFARLQVVRYTNIRFNEVPDSQLLDCNVHISLNKPSSLTFQPEGTNTAGDFGAAASLTYSNRNLFKGAEVLSFQLRGAYEAISKLEGYQSNNFMEYSAEAKLQFPRILAPFLSKSFKMRSVASSELSFGYDLQNRPEFHRRVFSLAWRYRWNSPKQHTNYRFDLFDLNYVFMPWISSTFKHDYLDSVSNRNAILRYNYRDLFIMKTGISITYNNGIHAIRAAIETSGNFLNAASYILGQKKNSNDQYTLFNIAFAQYVKVDFDYTRILKFDASNQLVFHSAFGFAYPYSNSTILPFEKRYFAGGANSMRGWSVRGLGPGKFKGSNGRIDFINQTGDMKLEMNLEYRTKLFWKLHGAAFIDAGNIWTIRNYNDQPGGKFKLNQFYKEIAVDYGFGLRLNFDYFILRFDMGMKAVNPAYSYNDEHWAFLHPNPSRDFSFHFAVGMPF